MAALSEISESCAANIFKVVNYKPLTNDDMMELRVWSKDVDYTAQMIDQSILIETSNLNLIDGGYDRLKKKQRCK